MGSYLTREAIFRADDRPTEEVHVPEWFDPELGTDLVLVRGLDGRGRDSYVASMTVQTRNGVRMDNTNATAKLVASCLVEPQVTLDDVDELGRRSGIALNRVYEVALRLSGLSEDDMAELGKASESTPSERSTSGSRKTSSTAR